MNEKLPLSPDTHSLSRRWLTSRNAQLFIRWPFFQAMRLDENNPLGVRLAARRRLIWSGTRWAYDSDTAQYLFPELHK